MGQVQIPPNFSWTNPLSQMKDADPKKNSDDLAKEMTNKITSGLDKTQAALAKILELDTNNTYTALDLLV